MFLYSSFIYAEILHISLCVPKSELTNMKNKLFKKVQTSRFFEKVLGTLLPEANFV